MLRNCVTCVIGSLLKQSREVRSKTAWCYNLDNEQNVQSLEWSRCVNPHVTPAWGRGVPNTTVKSSRDSRSATRISVPASYWRNLRVPRNVPCTLLDRHLDRIESKFPWPLMAQSPAQERKPNLFLSHIAFRELQTPSPTPRQFFTSPSTVSLQY